MHEFILCVVILFAYTVISAWCIRRSIVTFQKKEWLSFGFSATLTFMTLVHMAEFIILA